MKLFTGKLIMTIKKSLTITEKDRISFKRDLGVMRIFTSIMSFAFLFFFLFLDKINYQTVLSIYTFLTSEFFKIAVVGISAYIFIGSIVLRNFTYVFAICLFLFMQFLFVHVLDEDYSIDSVPRKAYENPPKDKYLYLEFWNMG